MDYFKTVINHTSSNIEVTLHMRQGNDYTRDSDPVYYSIDPGHQVKIQLPDVNAGQMPFLNGLTIRVGRVLYKLTVDADKPDNDFDRMLNTNHTLTIKTLPQFNSFVAGSNG